MNKNLYPGVVQVGLALGMVFLFCCSLPSNAQHIMVRVINDYAGCGVAAYSGDGGAATIATIDSPSSISLDNSGNLYIDDQRNYVVRKVDPSGIMSTIAGTGTRGYTANNVPATASELNESWGLAADGAGNVYISDQVNYRIRLVTPAGIISTIAGDGNRGYHGDGGPATNAEFISMLGITVDPAGNIFLADADTNCIRKITPAGIISTYAGNTIRGYYGDGGPALGAEFNGLLGLATDAVGNLYICDAENHCVRKVYTSGVITTIAGMGIPGYNGDGISANAALLNHPTGVFVNNAGEVFIADYGNNRVRKISTGGIISTVAGTAIEGYNGDDRLATTAQLNHPIGMVMDNNNNLFISDLDNVRIRKVSDEWMVSFLGGHFQNLTACEYPATASLSSVLSIHDYDAGATDHWSLLSGPYHGTVLATASKMSAGSIVIPAGVTYVPVTGYLGNDTFQVRVGNGLASDTTTVYVSMTPSFPPVGIITGDSMVCVGSTIRLTDNVTGGTWSSSNTTARVSGGIVTGQAAGIGIIYYITTNSCGSSTAEKFITINPLPYPGIITGASAVCEGASVILSDFVSGGTWGISNTSAKMLTGANGSLVTGVSAGADTIMYTVADAFCHATTIYGITIDTLINIGVITGPPAVCVGDQITLSDTLIIGSWSGTNGNATVAGGVVTGVSPGADTIDYSFTNSCGMVSADFVVTVNPLPSPPSISQNEYVLFATPNYYSYQWTANGTAVPGATHDSFFVVTGGTYIVIVGNSFGCINTSLPVTSSGCTPDELRIFPNPTPGIIYMEWCEQITARITCMDGKELRPIEKTNKVDLGGLPNGDYLLSVYDTNGKKIKTTCISKTTK
jgi:NHL repeat-containing protein